MPRVVRTQQAVLFKAQAVVTLTIGSSVIGWEVVKNAKDASSHHVNNVYKCQIYTYTHC